MSKDPKCAAEAGEVSRGRVQCTQRIQELSLNACWSGAPLSILEEALSKGGDKADFDKQAKDGFEAGEDGHGVIEG